MALMLRPGTAVQDRRHPQVPTRRLALREEDRVLQIQRGLYVVERGEKYALPVDHLARRNEWQGRDVWRHEVMPSAPKPEMAPFFAALGSLGGAEIHDYVVRLFRELCDAAIGGAGKPVTHRAGAVCNSGATDYQRLILADLKANVDPSIPERLYHSILGHDLHVSMWGDLFASHQHMGWADPFTGEVSSPLDPTFETFFKTHWVDHLCDLPVCPRTWGTWPAVWQQLLGLRGWVEPLGWLSGGKVTDAFVSEEIDELVSATSSEYADFDFHEVGTDNTAEDNNDTALGTSSGIARATGSPTDSDPVYQNVGTITADATETWEEHGLFNNSTSVALMDRSLTGGQSVNSSDQVQYTYQLTKNPEA